MLKQVCWALIRNDLAKIQRWSTSILESLPLRLWSCSIRSSVSISLPSTPIVERVPIWSLAKELGSWRLCANIVVQISCSEAAASVKRHNGGRRWIDFVLMWQLFNHYASPSIPTTATATKAWRSQGWHPHERIAVEVSRLGVAKLERIPKHQTSDLDQASVAASITVSASCLDWLWSWRCLIFLTVAIWKGESVCTERCFFGQHPSLGAWLNITANVNIPNLATLFLDKWMYVALLLLLLCSYFYLRLCCFAWG